MEETEGRGGGRVMCGVLRCGTALVYGATICAVLRECMGRCARYCAGVWCYQPMVCANGSRDCEPCPPGSYSDIIGQAQCTNCSLGSYAPAYASTVCTLCAVYQYNDAVGASACTLCPT
eukprot:2994667-Rhodomonas_salina.1